MTTKRSHSPRRRGICRIDQPSTRTHGWFVRVGYHRSRDGSYRPRHTKFFGDATHGGKRRALRAAEMFVAILTVGVAKQARRGRKTRRAKRAT